MVFKKFDAVLVPQNSTFCMRVAGQDGVGMKISSILANIYSPRQRDW